MEKSIAIKEISLINFKGLRNQKINFNHVTNIFGDNGVGKTTIFDAFTWLLFGKDSTDRKDFNVKTLDKYNKVIPQIEHEVSALLNVNGEDIQIKRVLREKWVKKRGSLQAEFNGNETIYFWNEVPKSQKEYQEKISTISNELVFKMITNPLAFNSMKWQDKRTTLIDIVGNVSDSDIAGDDKSFNELLSKLTNKSLDEYKKQIAAQRKRLNDELKSIPTRIDEVSRNVPDALDFDGLKNQKIKLDKEKQNIQSQIDDKNKAYDETLKRKQKVSNEIFELKSKAQNIEFELKQNIERSNKEGNSELDQLKKDLSSKNLELTSVNNSIKTLQSQLGTLQSQLQNASTKIDNKRNEWEKVNAEELKFNEDSFSCPTCKRGFDAESVEAKKLELKKTFDNNKAQKLADINLEGKSLSKEKSSIEESILTLKKRIENEEESSKEISLVIVNLESLIEKASNKDKEKEVVNPEELLKAALKNHSGYNKILEEISLKETEVNNITQLNVDDLKLQKDSIDNQIKEIDEKLMIEVQINNSKERISTLQNQEESLSQQISDVEKEQFTIENFIKKKIDTLESKINEKFNYVKFKLFETQINGAEVECCHTLIGGVPFSDANKASKINGGLDIINTLCEFYQVTAPIFIDNRESVVNIIDCKSQIINLIVSKPDKTLRVA